MSDYKQIIIARKDLNMTPGKLAAQVSHASMAFLTTQIKNNSYKTLKIGYSSLPVLDSLSNKRRLYLHPDIDKICKKAYENGEKIFYTTIDKEKHIIKVDKPEYKYDFLFSFDADLYENWINGSFTKVVCGARNKNQLIKSVQIAQELGLKEGKDYFLIKDNCYTELEPEEIDAEGVGRTLTCIGFVPLPAETASLISKKYQLY